MPYGTTGHEGRCAVRHNLLDKASRGAGQYSVAPRHPVTVHALASTPDPASTSELANELTRKNPNPGVARGHGDRTAREGRKIMGRKIGLPERFVILNSSFAAGIAVRPTESQIEEEIPKAYHNDRDEIGQINWLKPQAIHVRRQKPET